jgi:hypothetical protein
MVKRAVKRKKHRCVVKLCPECYHDYENGTITYEKKCKVLLVNSVAECARAAWNEE